MSGFTDEDLGRLKEAYAKHESTIITKPRIDALLARMEAAEDCAEHLGFVVGDCEHLQAWRKACGK